MQAKSFIDILSNELRKEIRAEVEAELAAAKVSPAVRLESSAKAEQVELWLNLKIGGAFTGNTSTKTSAYQKFVKPRPANRHLQLVPQSQAVLERIGSAITIEQTLALEFFKREGAAIEASFTETELKSEFRKIAMRIHPDRHVKASAEQLKGLSSRFQTLVDSAEILEATLA